MVDVTLTAGQRRVLEHVRLFRITTQDVLERLYFRGREKNVKSFLQRLRKRGFLDFAPLTSRRNYYHLTQRGLQLLGAPDLRAGPLKGDSLVERYGILEFCSRRPGARQKLSKEDFATRFPQLAPRNMPGTCYYVDAEEEPRRYGWVYVHRSAPAWRVQTRVVQNILGRRYAHEEWKRVIDAGQFAVAVVSSTAQKSAELREIFSGDWPQVTFRFEVIEELLPILDRQVEDAR